MDIEVPIFPFTDEQIFSSFNSFDETRIATLLFFNANENINIENDFVKERYLIYIVQRSTVVNFRTFNMNMKKFFFIHYSTKLLKEIIDRYKYDAGHNEANQLEKFKVTIKDFAGEQRARYSTNYIQFIWDNLTTNEEIYQCALSQYRAMDSFENVLTSSQNVNEFTNTNVQILVETLFKRRIGMSRVDRRLRIEQGEINRNTYLLNFTNYLINKDC